jgi:hypothetical protein
MNGKAGLSTAIALLTGPVPAAWAATGRQDSSPLVVWTFLGFCALIVVAQLLPAFRSARRAAAAKRRRLAQRQAVKVPARD